MTTTRKLNIISPEDHAELTQRVNTRAQELHQAGVGITPEGITQFKIEGLFETMIDVIRAVSPSVSRDDAVRLIDTNFLEAMDKYLLTTGEEARKEAVRQRLAVGSMTPEDMRRIKEGQ